MKVAIVTTKTVGQRRGKTIRLKVRSGPEPHVLALSSKEASICRNAGVSKIVITGTVSRVK